jgi:peroxiredoxin
MVVKRALLLAAALAACAHPSVVGSALASLPLPGTDGKAHDTLPPAGSRFTVLVFFDAHCPCQSAHDARLRDLYATYHPRGVDVFAVDSQTGATAESDANEASRRAYPFPILVDRGGALARRVGAEYATDAIVLDARGVVRYHGGIDSDKRDLHDDATPYLKDALDDLLADRPPRRAQSEALGCALQTW